MDIIRRVDRRVKGAGAAGFRHPVSIAAPVEWVS